MRPRPKELCFSSAASSGEVTRSGIRLGRAVHGVPGIGRKDVEDRCLVFSGATLAVIEVVISP